ncbi:MAG: hypothetical protein IPK53_17720 [bacterium]|nr:hypothetical protein [bacterium]
MTHEFSHLYGVDHESGYYGTGAFALMTGTGFADPDTVTIPSPYIPAASTGSYLSSMGGEETQYFYYSLPDCLILSTQNNTLRDFETFGDAVMLVPDQLTGADALNYFLVTNHQRRNDFEFNWPGTGLLITHVIALRRTKLPRACISALILSILWVYSIGLNRMRIETPWVYLFGDLILHSQIR